MKEVRPGTTGSSDMLDSWKAIAGYFHRGVRTVMRWELVRGLPVHRVPGSGKPGVYALKSELNVWWSRRRPHLLGEADDAAPNPRMTRVAVLPFVNLSADKENEYFGDGLADEIITALTRVQGLKVIARTSSFALRGKEQDVRKIGAALGVSALLEGSVQRCAGRVRVSAQLVDANEGIHLWSDHFDRELADVFAIQDEISAAIAGVLEVQLGSPRGGRRTVNLEAYNLWLKGRYYQQYENVEAFAKSNAYFERAIELDPLFPNPYLGLAELCRAASDFGAVRPRDVGTQGRSALRKALELDDSLGEAYALSGAYRAWLDFDWKGAEGDFQRALALTPGSQDVHWLRAITYLVPNHRLAEAEQETRRAVELDPLSPLAYTFLAKVLLWARQFDLAQANIDAALELRPDYAIAQWYRGAAWWFQGRMEDAFTLWHASMRKIGPNPAMKGAIGMGLGYLGRDAEARAMRVELESAARESYVTPTAVAQINLGLGEIDAVFKWLDRAVDERDPHILDLPCKPIWDRLRPDPRYTALMRKMRLG